MGTPNPPSLIWGLPQSTPPTVDAPIQQDATFIAGALYRSYVDSQIRGSEKHLVQSLLSGLTATWVQVNSQSAPIAVGQWVCAASQADQTVTLAVLAALSTAGQAAGIALSAGRPGTWIVIAMQGAVPPSVTGLLIGSHLYAQVNTSTAYTSTVTSLGSNSYPVGTVDGGANLNVRIQLPPAPGGASLSVTGTGFWPVVGGVPGSAARAVNLSSNGVNGDVTSLLPWANGGHAQGIIHVANGSPGTLSNVVQIAFMESNTGTTSVTIPTPAQFGGTIPDGFIFSVLDTGGLAPTSAITVSNPGAQSILDPNALAITTGSITLSTPWVAVTWMWDATALHWAVLDQTLGGGRVPAPGAIITANTALGPTNLWNLFAANGETLTQNSPIPGELYRYTHAPGGAFNNTLTGDGQVTLAAGTGGFTIIDPQNTMATAAATAKFKTDQITYEFILDSGSNVFKCVN